MSNQGFGPDPIPDYISAGALNAAVAAAAIFVGLFQALAIIIPALSAFGLNDIFQGAVIILCGVLTAYGLSHAVFRKSGTGWRRRKVFAAAIFGVALSMALLATASLSEPAAAAAIAATTLIWSVYGLLALPRIRSSLEWSMRDHVIETVPASEKFQKGATTPRQLSATSANASGYIVPLFEEVE